jgi:3-dehydroquinate dehydratase/shikimate dehydrogenase
MTLLAVPITRPGTHQAIADLRRAVEKCGADAVELRLDYMTDVNLAELMRNLPPGVRVIATARDPAEGGVWKIDDASRLAGLAEAARFHPDYLDIELATWRRCAEARTIFLPHLNGPPARAGQDESCKLILSSHDLAGRPKDLDGLLAAMEAEPCDIVKIVWQAESACDVLRAFDLMRSGRKPIIVIVMGEAGLASRVLAKKFGAFLSFCSLEEGAGSAPGQIDIARMKHLYRWDQIGPGTGVYGVIGCPIAHSMSPAIHNAAMAACGIDGVYLPFRVEPGWEHFEPFVRGLMDRPWMDLRGLSVTIPHKENALRFVGDSVEPLARRIGAVNTLVFDQGGKVRGLNTDYAGALDALTRAMGCGREDLAGLPVAVLGAGGASRGVVAGLRHCGCEVTIYNRTYERAKALATEFDCKAEPFAAACRLRAKIVVNTTSIGMHPNVDETPLDAGSLRPDMVVFDNVYNPMETRLLREAAAAGCRTVSGVDMFVNQAVAQFEAWTHRAAPRELMRRVVVEALTETSKSREVEKSK